MSSKVGKCSHEWKLVTDDVGGRTRTGLSDEKTAILQCTKCGYRTTARSSELEHMLASSKKQEHQNSEHVNAEHILPGSSSPPEN